MEKFIAFCYNLDNNESRRLFMQSEFKAVVLANEIDLNKIAEHFGINRQFRWEETLILAGKSLEGITRQAEGKRVYLYHFGSVVFLNFQHHEMMDVVNYLRKIEKSLATGAFEYVDDYILETVADLTEADRPYVSNDRMLIAQEESYHREIVATMLARSVALEKIEVDISRLLDEIEEIVTFLHMGNLNMSDRRLAKLSAKIFGFKLNMVSYIMLLDKPDITWNNAEASQLYDEMGRLFEVSERYQKIRQKAEVLTDITEVFAGLAHASRGTRLEWAVILLIAFEIVLSLLDIFVLK
jgi:uncharacterized Rmd1/YagE family protein